MPNPSANKTRKIRKKAAHPKTVQEAALDSISSHVRITQSTASSHMPPDRSSISTAGSRMSPDLSQIPSKDLDCFIQDHLRPSPQFQQQVKQAIDAILCCLREKSVYKVLRVSKVSPKMKVPLEGPWGTTVVREGPQQSQGWPGELNVLGSVACWLGIDKQTLLGLQWSQVLL